MQADIIAATAACAAAALSLINVGVQARFARSGESQRWRRDTLPTTVQAFGAAVHKVSGLTYFRPEQWAALSTGERQEHGTDEYQEALRWLGVLEVVGSTPLVVAARRYLFAVRDSLRWIRGNAGTPEWSSDEDDRQYWNSIEMYVAYLSVARSDLGLDPLPPPRGLAGWRDRRQ